MRARAAVLLLTVTAGAGLGVVVPVSAPASCVGPSLAVPGVPTEAPTTSPTGRQVGTVRLRAGQAVTVRGAWFFRGCHDTGGSSGCSGPSAPRPERPARDVTLTLTQDGRRWALGTADAGPPERRYAVRWDVVLPSDVRPGAAVLSAGPAAEINVLVSR